MNATHLRLQPHRFKKHPNVWWYEEPQGITVVTKHDTGKYESVLIPWKTLRAALKRKDQKR